MTESETTDDLFRRARAGDTPALGLLFAHYRKRLRNMVRLRLDCRVARRLDPSDCSQEAYLDVARRFPEYAAAQRCRSTSGCGPTGQRLIDLHRQHLGARMRDAGQEVSLYPGGCRRRRRHRWPAASGGPDLADPGCRPGRDADWPRRR